MTRVWKEWESKEVYGRLLLGEETDPQASKVRGGLLHCENYEEIQEAERSHPTSWNAYENKYMDSKCQCTIQIKSMK